MSAMFPDFEELCRSVLVEKAAQLGLAGERRGRWVWLDQHGLRTRFQVRTFTARFQADLSLVKFELIMLTRLRWSDDPHNQVIDVWAVRGNKLEEDVRDGAVRWVERVFHPLLLAVDPAGTEEPAFWGEGTDVTGRRRRWEVFASPYQLRGVCQDELRRALERVSLWTLLPLTETLTRANRPVNWIRITLWRRADRARGDECLVNNEAWGRAYRRLHRFGWPRVWSILGRLAWWVKGWFVEAPLMQVRVFYFLRWQGQDNPPNPGP